MGACNSMPKRNENHNVQKAENKIAQPQRKPSQRMPKGATFFKQQERYRYFITIAHDMYLSKM
jgi:hypothetical protein